MKRPVKWTRLVPFNDANPVRKQGLISPAHALIQKAMWPRNFQLIMFLHRNPGATRKGICDLMKWPLWKLQNQFTKMFRCGLLTRVHVGSRIYRYYLTREASLIAKMVVQIEEALSAGDRARDLEE